MQIVEKSGEGLSRVFGVTVPMADLGVLLEARIAEITPTLNIKGFRPGKVPTAHVRRLYGKALMSEVVEKTLNETTQKVLDDNKLRPGDFTDVSGSWLEAVWIHSRRDQAYAFNIVSTYDMDEIRQNRVRADDRGPSLECERRE